MFLTVCNILLEVWGHVEKHNVILKNNKSGIVRDMNTDKKDNNNDTFQEVEWIAGSIYNWNFLNNKMV